MSKRRCFRDRARRVFRRAAAGLAAVTQRKSESLRQTGRELGRHVSGQADPVGKGSAVLCDLLTAGLYLSFRVPDPEWESGAGFTADREKSQLLRFSGGIGRGIPKDLTVRGMAGKLEKFFI